MRENSETENGEMCDANGMSWLCRERDWLGLYGIPFGIACIILISLGAFFTDQADMRSSGTVEDVVDIYDIYGRERSYSIVTINGEEYRYYGAVPPKEVDEIMFTEVLTEEGEVMSKWHLAD